jgi:hypothetical protein
MVELSTKKPNTREALREFLISNDQPSQDSLQKAVDFLNSGKHPLFPGAKQRVTVEDLRKAGQLISQAVSDPNSTVSKGLDNFLKRSDELGNKLQSIKNDLENPTFLSRIKAFFKTIVAKMASFIGLASYMESVTSSPA